MGDRLNNYIKKGVVAGLCLTQIFPVMANPISGLYRRLVEEFHGNDDLSITGMHGKESQGDSSNSTIDVNLTSTPIKVYSKKDDQSIQYFDFGIGLQGLYNKNEGTFTFGADFKKEMTDFNFLCEFNYSDINKYGNGFALNLEGALGGGNLSDTFSNQNADLKSGLVSADIQGILNINGKSNVNSIMEVFFGLGYTKDINTYSIAPDGSSQAIDSNSDIINLNGGLFIYDMKAESLIRLGGNLGIRTNDGKVVGGGNMHIKANDTLGFGVDVNGGMDKVSLSLSLDGYFDGWNASIVGKIPIDQSNPNIWDSSAVGVKVGLDLDRWEKYIDEKKPDLTEIIEKEDYSSTGYNRVSRK